MRILFLILTLCVLVAIVIQDYTSFLPLGVFNSNLDQYNRLSMGCLLLGAVAFLIQALDVFAGRMSAAAGLLRGAWVFLIILEGLLFFGDRLFVTGNPGGRLGQYHEERLSDGSRVVFKKRFGAYEGLACPRESASLDGDAFNIVFLGDSYTEGSGSGEDCNYPNVVEKVLRQQWRDDVRVVNAGVSGYGPEDAYNLLRWYVEQECTIDLRASKLC